MPESKNVFDDIILTKEEAEGIKKLKQSNELHRKDIPGFDGLRKIGFVTLAHKETIKPDGYGTFTCDEIYRISDRYDLYVTYLRKKGFMGVLKLLGEIIP